MPRPDPERLLDDLNDAQREAVLATTGPVAILAGGRHRQDPGHQPPHRVRDRDRRRRAGPGPRRHVHRQGRARDGRAAAGARAAGRHGPDVPCPCPEPAPPLLAARTTTATPLPTCSTRSCRCSCRWPAALPGHYRFTPAKDLADEIEWAKSRRLTPTTYERAVAGSPTTTPDASRRSRSTCSCACSPATSAPKTRAGRIDFDDLLVETIDLLEGDADAAATVRARKRWFSVDEYQDTNPLQQRLLELWLGERRGRVRRRRRGPDDLHVHRRDEHVPDRVRGALSRTRGSSRLSRQLPIVAGGARARPTDCSRRAGRAKRLVATRPTGPEPTVVRHGTESAELAALARVDPRTARRRASRRPRSPSSSG